MKLKLLITALVLSLLSTTVLAQLDPFTDYEISDELWNITLIQVDPNMGDDYLEGLRDTWGAANKVAMELGQIATPARLLARKLANRHAGLACTGAWADAAAPYPPAGQHCRPFFVHRR
jgi:hypothetical protein